MTLPSLDDIVLTLTAIKTAFDLVKAGRELLRPPGKAVKRPPSKKRRKR